MLTRKLIVANCGDLKDVVPYILANGDERQWPEFVREAIRQACAWRGVSLDGEVNEAESVDPAMLEEFLRGEGRDVLALLPRWDILRRGVAPLLPYAKDGSVPPPKQLLVEALDEVCHMVWHKGARRYYAQPQAFEALMKRASELWPVLFP